MRRARERLGMAGALAAASALVVACGSTQPSASSVPGTSPGPAATASFDVPASFGPPPSPTPPDDATPLVLDPDLLAYLPESIDGVAVTESADEAAVALNDPGLPRIAVAVNAAVAVDAGSGSLVYGWIVRLRPGIFTDADFRQWRDAYDDGACGGAVVGRAQAVVGGREAYVTSCESGLHTYHLWLEDQDLLISASAVGASRFGEKLLEGLRVPA